MSGVGEADREKEELFIRKNIKKNDGEATNAYGEIDFGRNSIFHAKYVRVAANTDVKILHKLLVEHWELKSPNLIISVVGVVKNFKLQPDLMKVFQKSLMKVAKKMSAWITTGGWHSGVAMHVGKAVEKYGTNTEDGDKVVSIGIVPWNVISENEKLVNDEKNPQFSKSYDAEEQNQGAKVILDHNHSHFILVDNGEHGEDSYGGELELRTKLERYIANIPRGDGINVATVCVMVQGGLGALKTAALSISSGTPVVIVEGSGGLADVIARVYRSDRHSFDEEWALLHFPHLKEWYGQDLEKVICLLNECMKGKSLLKIYSLNPMDPSWDLDTAILGILLEAHGADQSYSKKDRLLNQTMHWNRSDIAESLLLKEDIKALREDFAKVFFQAIKENKHEFCKVLLDYGVHLKKFCTVEILMSLYASAPEVSDLHREMTKHGIRDVQSIGKVMKEYLGPSYNTNQYSGTSNNTSGCKVTSDSTKQYSAIASTTNPTEDKSKLKLDDPYVEIFQWAILMNYREIAKHVWEYMTESMAAAAMASKILKTMATKMEYNDKEKQNVLADAAEYEKLAAGILQKCFSKDPHKTCDVLTAQCPKWGGYSCLQIAVAADDKHFVSMPGVRYFLKNLWMGKLAINTPSWRIMLAGICPLFVFTVRRKEKPSDIVKKEKAVQETRPSSNDVENNTIANQTDDDTPDEQNRRTRTEKISFLNTYYNAPVVKFLMNVIGFVIFLLLFAFIILSNFSVSSVTVSKYEYVLFGWIITLSFEEIREIYGQQRCRVLQKIFLHIRDPWNIMDITSMILFYVGFALRFSVRFLHVTQALYSISFMIQCVRIVHLFTMHSVLGPKIVMIGKMLKDLVFFLFIMMVFLLAYGVASQALLYPNETSLTEIMVGIIYRPYWQIFGELFLDEINYNPNVSGYYCSDTESDLPRCPQQNVLVPIISAVYLVLANVLLLNLLIAMFSYTFETVQNHDEIWRFERCKFITSYYFRPALIPPLIIISHVIRFVQWCRGEEGATFDRGLRKNLNEDDLSRLRKWERFRAEEFMREKHEEDDKTGDRQLETISSRIGIIMSATENIISRLQRLEESRSDSSQSKSK